MLLYLNLLIFLVKQSVLHSGKVHYPLNSITFYHYLQHFDIELQQLSADIINHQLFVYILSVVHFHFDSIKSGQYNFDIENLAVHIFLDKFYVFIEVSNVIYANSKAILLKFTSIF